MSTRLLILLFLAAFAVSCNQETKPEQKPKEDQAKLTKAPKAQKKQTSARQKDKRKRLNDKKIAPFLRNYFEENTERTISLNTDFGRITVRLYEDTPLHSANFLMLAKEYYDGTLFYRVAKDFVVQGGESDDSERQQIKRNLGKYTIPSEFRPQHIHKRGALAMTREYENNPNKRSAQASFYIVQGKVWRAAELKALEREENIKFTPEQVETYTTIGGNPSLDGVHTVFGEVTEGLDVIAKIAQVEVDKTERPNEDILIRIESIR